jgi:hypothetical protein
MTWTLGDALGHTKKATSAPAKRQWASTANAVLADSGDEGKAVRIANAAVKKRSAKPKQSRSMKKKKGKRA